MNWINSLFGKNEPKEEEEEEEESTSYVTRLGKCIVADEVFFAWTSGDLNRMFKASKLSTNLIDRHFLLLLIVMETYKMRKDEKYRNLCIEYSELHLNEFPQIAPVLKENVGGNMPSVPTFQNYATILTETGDFAKAISVCEMAISYGLNDGTKSDFLGRIERIKKKSKFEK